uniref:Carbohydrate ABC transporter permease n=1 Tax=Dictyoglomus thermophilum TaxID=14 RepID=A0A7C3RNG8_DICTH
MKRSMLADYIIMVILIALSIIMLLPFLWMFFTSLKDWGEIFKFPPTIFPSKVRWENYSELFQMAPVWAWFKNSMFLSVMSTIGVLVSSSIIAFAFAVINFKGKSFWFSLLLLTMMVPFHTTMIPQYILFRYLGWINTLKPLWVPTFTGAPYMIFLLRQYYRSIPQSYLDAAKIDGASFWYIFKNVYVPLSLPVTVTVGLLTFINQWNYFLGPLIYLNDVNKMTLTAGLSFLQGQSFGYWNYIMVGATIAVVPILILFLFTQKFIIEGIMLQAGIK